MEAETEKQQCIGCEGHFDEGTMKSDSAGENYCAECWEVLAPIMAAEYRELVEKGEMEPED